jgi:tripartite-type tricarboxylate transporter receptor subunit TctC
MCRVRAILACAAVAGLALTVPAGAQDYPSKPIRIVVPIAAGGVADIAARALAQKVGEGGKYTIVVENRTGGAGVPGTDTAAKAAPDGYTFLMGYHGVLSILPHMTKLPYDPVKDFVPVVNVVMVPNILVVHPSVPAKNIKELIAYAKANPGKLSYASQGVGSTGHLGGELFKQLAGIDLVHVPYRGAAPAQQDLIAGHVQLLFDVITLARGPVADGRLRAIGVADKARSEAVPNVPTLAEQGLDLTLGAWFGLVAPAGTPKQAVAWMNEQANKAFATPESRKRFSATGATMPLGTPEAFGKHIAAETVKFGEVVRKGNIKLK